MTIEAVLALTGRPSCKLINQIYATQDPIHLYI